MDKAPKAPYIYDQTDGIVSNSVVLSLMRHGSILQRKES